MENLDPRVGNGERPGGLFGGHISIVPQVSLTGGTANML